MNSMKKIVIALILILSVSLVGCSYKVKDEDIYNKGQHYFESKENKELKLSEKIDRTSKILDGSYKIDEFNKEDKQKQYNDYKYGILQSTIETLDKANEKGIEDTLIKNESTMIELDELREKQKKLYGEEYNKIIQEYITIFTEIKENYKGENIDKTSVEKIDKLKKENEVLEKKIQEQTTEVLVNSIMDKLPKTYKATGTIRIK